MRAIKKMGHCAPHGIVAITLLLIVWQWESIFATETSNCFCYSFHNITKNWEDSNKICQDNNGTLVSMETEEEYQFINKTIQSLDVGKNEWYIGLERISGNYWNWISGSSITITDTGKWVPGQPKGDGDCVKMIKHYKGRGLFDDIYCRTLYMFICEHKQAQKCSNITSTTNEKRCFSKRKQVTTKENTMTPSFSPTTKETLTTTATTPTHVTTVQGSSPYPSPPTKKISSNENEHRTKAFVQTTKPKSVVYISFSTENKKTKDFVQPTLKKAVVYISFSTENKKTKDFVQPTLKKGDANSPNSRSTESGPFPLVIVTVALGAVLAVSVCMLFLVCYWKRRKNRGDNNEKPKSETTSLPRDAIEQSSNNQGPEDGGLTEGVQLFSQNGGESYVSYAVIHNNLTQQNQSPTASNEPAYASIEDEKMMKKSSKNDPIAAMPAATMNVENSGNSVGGKKSNAEAVYASVDKKKKNNIKNEGQEGQPWPTGQQVVYASVDKSKKSRAQAEDVVYAEVGSKDNTDKQQPQQITYAELADFTRDAPQEAVKPAPYQPAEYAVIIGQKQKP